MISITGLPEQGSSFMHTQPSQLRDLDGPETVFSGRLDGNRTQRFGFGYACAIAIIPLFLIIFAVLAFDDVDRTLEWYPLLCALNLSFLVVMPSIVAFSSLRAYSTNGHISLLMLGNGALSLGLGSVLAVLAPWFGGGPNSMVTIHNTAALLSASFHCAGAARALGRSQKRTMPERRGLYVSLAAALIFLFLTVLFFAALRDVTPTFFVQGVGPTRLRQVVLGTSIVLFGISACLLGAVFAISRSQFVSWYWMGLALIVIGLLCVFTQKSVGSDIGWLGRAAQYVGGSYLLAAIITAAKELRNRDLSFVSNLWTFFFNNLEITVAERTRELVDANQRLTLEIAARKRAENALRESHAELERHVEERTLQLKVCNEHQIQEISGRKRAEELLRNSEEKFRLFMDNSPAIAWMKDDRGRYVFLNRTYEKRFGARPEDCVGKTDYELWQREIADDFRKSDQAVLAAGCTMAVTQKITETDGQPYHWSSHKFPFQDSSGNWYVGGIGIDVTESQRKEEELRRSESMLRAVLDQMPSAVTIRDAKTGCLILSNRRGREIVGDLPENGDPFEHFQPLHSDGHPLREEELPILRSMLSGEMVDAEEILMKRSDGSTIILTVSSVPVRDEKGQIILGVRIFHDITGRKRAQEALRKAHDELESRVRVRTAELSLANDALRDEIRCRVAAEAALRDSEEKYRLIFSKVRDAIFVIDAESHMIIEMNDAALHLSGYTREELLKRTPLDTSVEPEKVRAAIARSKHPHGIDAEVEWHKRKDGTVHPCEISAGPFMWRGQMRICAVVRNVSERLGVEESLRKGRDEFEQLVIKRTADLNASKLRLESEIAERIKTEAALRESESRYRAIFEGSKEGILIIEHQTMRFKFANQAISDMLGYSQDEMSGLGVQDIHPKDRMEHVIRGFQAHSRGEKTKAESIACLRKDGTVFYADISTTVIEVDGVPCTVGFFWDITVRKKAQDDLRASELRFRSVFESATECIYLINTNSKYTHVNPAVERLFGTRASEIVGKGPEYLYGTEIGKKIRGINSRVLTGQRIEHEQVRMIEGTPVTFHEIRVPLRDSQNRIIGICCLSRYTAPSLARDKYHENPDERYPSPVMHKTLRLARAATRSKGIVLLLGESGSGKDHLARWIHDHSPFASGPFVSVNCAAIPKDLAESELFGHERGAFTGAAVQKRGRLEMAEGGTILLNEIGELDLSLQSKLLSFLDTSSFLRVGGQKQVNVNARLIAATHRNLKREVSEGRFSAPLFYRLSVLTIDVPPLRARVEDLPLLVKDIMGKVVLETDLSTLPTVDEQHLKLLSTYPWPGNVRELRNVIERSLILWDGGKFTLAVDTAKDVAESSGIHVPYSPGKPLRDAHQEVTAYFLDETLRHCAGHKTMAAHLLGISRDAFYRYLKKMHRSS